MVKIKGKVKGPALLLSAAVIWGLSFVAQSVGTESVGAFTFNGLRTVLGCVSLLPVILINNVKGKSKKAVSEQIEDKKELFKAGVFCGLPLFFGSNLQQAAFGYTSVGKVGFITAMYMILVPVFGLFLKRKVRPIVWFCVFVAAFGMYLLCISGSFTLNKGDLLTLFCAMFFAAHILTIDHFSQRVDCVKLSCLQFLVSGTLSVICMFIFEKPETSAIMSVIPELLYAGIMSCSVAFTFQVAGQKYTEPAIASMLLCLESVFALIFGWVILKQSLNAREITGCAVMFAAIILAQLPERLKLGNKESSTENRLD